jgi:hypothetical protein
MKRTSSIGHFSFAFDDEHEFLDEELITRYESMTE